VTPVFGVAASQFQMDGQLGNEFHAFKGTDQIIKAGKWYSFKGLDMDMGRLVFIIF
jgi:hypothetical protein